MRAEGGEATFIAVRLPYRVQHDADDATAAMVFIAADEGVEVNIEHGVDGLENDLEAAGLEDVADFHRGNIKARLRMVTQAAIAGQRGLLVIGTDHAAEAVTGFFTSSATAHATSRRSPDSPRGRAGPCCSRSAPRTAWPTRCPPPTSSTGRRAAPTRTSWD